MIRFIFCLALTTFATAATAAPIRAAVFDFELIDTSLTGEMKGVSKAETERLTKLAPELREKLAASGLYEIVPIDAVETEAKGVHLQSCGGCDVAMAKKLGADLAITGTLQKDSESILNVNVYMRDTHSGELLHAYSADIRNNTDEGWMRGLSYVIRNRILDVPQKAAQ